MKPFFPTAVHLNNGYIHHLQHIHSLPSSFCESPSSHAALWVIFHFFHSFWNSDGLDSFVRSTFLQQLQIQKTPKIRMAVFLFLTKPDKVPTLSSMMSLPYFTLLKFGCLHLLTSYLVWLSTFLRLWVPRTTLVRLLCDHQGNLAEVVIWKSE